MASLNYDFLKNYTQKGVNQLDTIQNNINSLIGQENDLGNNQNIYNQLNSGYQNSPETQYKIDQMMNYNRNANATQGTAGGGYNRFDDLNAINQLTSQGQQQYYNNRLGLYNTGLGLSQGLSNNGLQAGNSILNGELSEAQMAQQQAQFEAEQKAKQEANNPNFLKAAGSFIGNSILPGVGGVIGNVAGNFASEALGKIGGDTSNPVIKDLLELKKIFG
jgi:hypothetical protein